MAKRMIAVGLIALGTGLLLMGCNTIPSRVQDMTTMQLCMAEGKPGVQDELRRRWVTPGDCLAVQATAMHYRQQRLRDAFQAFTRPRIIRPTGGHRY